MEVARGILDGERIVVICRTARDAKNFFRDVVDVLRLECGLEDVIMASRHDQHTIRRLDGIAYIMLCRWCRGVSADAVIFDEGALDVDSLATARMCVMPRGGKVIE